MSASLLCPILKDKSRVSDCIQARLHQPLSRCHSNAKVTKLVIGWKLLSLGRPNPKISLLLGKWRQAFLENQMTPIVRHRAIEELYLLLHYLYDNDYDYGVLPFRRIPFRRIPFRRIPFRRIPFRRIPFCRIPFRRIPFRRIPFRRIPFRRMPFIRRISCDELRLFQMVGAEKQKLRLAAIIFFILFMLLSFIASLHI